ncbi:hypothetical protein PCANC_08561 [Puccinia coronata f. sp. avenae]|uniref:Uncharacterized protein n=1 Tax=Puccinia coronata f. sp. avenae TaxID=200324 RepID=A0A2N5S2B8_9BASI|nr:hypothetical protein PCANC_26154 [Puccinia coronata f. sp. avenae]PLW44022.1 hypothetical protein PCANC_08561 [Puccinia coronata f. sp. avenae]
MGITTPEHISHISQARDKAVNDFKAVQAAIPAPVANEGLSEQAGQRKIQKHSFRLDNARRESSPEVADVPHRDPQRIAESLSHPVWTSKLFLPMDLYHPPSSWEFEYFRHTCYGHHMGDRDKDLGPRKKIHPGLLTASQQQQQQQHDNARADPVISQSGPFVDCLHSEPFSLDSAPTELGSTKQMKPLAQKNSEATDSKQVVKNKGESLRSPLQVNEPDVIERTSKSEELDKGGASSPIPSPLPEPSFFPRVENAHAVTVVSNFGPFVDSPLSEPIGVDSAPTELGSTDQIKPTAQESSAPTESGEVGKDIGESPSAPLDQINEHKKKGGTSKEKELDKELALTSVSSPPPESSSLAEAHATGKDDWEKDPNMIDPVIASSVKEMSDIRTADDLRSDGSAMYVPSRSPGPSPLLKAQATRVSQDESQTSQNLNDQAIVSSVKQMSRSRTARVQPDGEASSSPSPPSGPSSHHTARTPGVSKDKLKKNMTLNDQVIGSRVKKMSRGRTSHEPQPAESTVHPSLTKAKATASSEDRLNNLNSNDEGIASHLEKPSGIETAHDLERKKGLVVKKNQISSIKSHLASEQEDQTARPKISEEIISNNPQTQSNLNGSESNMTRKYGVNIEPDIKIAETIHQENNDKPFTKPQETYSSQQTPSIH